MNSEMQDLTVAKSQGIITRSNSALDEINALLRGILPPSRVRLTVDMPPSIRFNRMSMLHTVVTKTGDRDSYARVYCDIVGSNNQVIREMSGCLTLAGTNDYDVSFSANVLGQWRYSCTLARSAMSDCSFEINQTPISGIFTALPGFGTYIDSMFAPSNLIRGQTAVVTVSVNNPDDAGKFATVRCDFTDPQLVARRNSSSCVGLDAGGTSSAEIRMLADKLGNWTVSRCQVSASEFSGCAGAALDNVSQQSANYSVILPDDVFIESITVPDSVLNGTSTSIVALVNNPKPTPAYVTVNCNVVGPDASLVIIDRKGVEQGASRTFALNFVPNAIGTWTVFNCTAFKSTSPDFSGSVPVFTAGDIRVFNVIIGNSLTIVAASFAPEVANGTSANIDVSVRNPAVTRFGTVSCRFRDTLNLQFTNVSSCFQATGGSDTTASVRMFLGRRGTWNIDSCSVSGSINSDCSSAALHDTKSPVGQFNSSGSAAVCTTCSAFSSVHVVSVSPPTGAVNNTNVDITVVAGNPLENNNFAHTSCSVRDPSNTTRTVSSPCKSIQPNSTSAYALPIFVNITGTWNITACSVNASSSCASAVQKHSLNASRIFGVSESSSLDLYISNVSAQDAAVNNSNVAVDIFVNNPLDDDRYGSVNCLIEQPNGVTQTRSAQCGLVTRQGSRRYNVSVFANAVGTWTVRNCSVSSSSNSACSPVLATSSIIDSDTFEVLRGYNLTITDMSITAPAYTQTSIDVSYKLRNPSSSERFGRVTCTFGRSGQSIVNRSACFTLPPESFVDSKANLTTDAAGQWTVTCNAERSLDSGCSSLEMHDSVSST